MFEKQVDALTKLMVWSIASGKATPREIMDTALGFKNKIGELVIVQACLNLLKHDEEVQSFTGMSGDEIVKWIRKGLANDPESCKEDAANNHDH